MEDEGGSASEPNKEATVLTIEDEIKGQRELGKGRNQTLTSQLWFKRGIVGDNVRGSCWEWRTQTNTPRWNRGGAQGGARARGRNHSCDQQR